MQSTVYVGIDLHQDSLTVCIMDAGGQCRFEVLPTKVRNRITSFFADLAAQHHVVATVESVGFYHWFWDVVQPLVDSLTLADASRVRSAAGRRAKTDRNDAQTLARLLRQDSLPTAFVPDPELRAFRNLVRHRERVRRRITSCKNSLRREMAKLNMPGPKLLHTGTLHKWFTACFQRLSPMAQFAIKDLAEQLALFERQMLNIDDTIKRTVENTLRFRDPIERLQTIPGIGLITAAVIHAETGGLARFDLEGELICYAGLAPRTFQSAEQCRHGRIGKDGPPIMRKCLINAAWAAVRTDPDVKTRFEQYRRTKGKKKAIVKLAARILAWAWAMERTGTAFEVQHLRPKAA